jgi:hypothetical protein
VLDILVYSKEELKMIKDLELDEDLLSIINGTYIEDRYHGELGLLLDGMLSTGK